MAPRPSKSHVGARNARGGKSCQVHHRGAQGHCGTSIDINAIDVSEIAGYHDGALDNVVWIVGIIAHQPVDGHALEDREVRGIDDVDFIGIDIRNDQPRAVGIESQIAEGADAADARNLGVDRQVDHGDVVGIDVANVSDAAIGRNGGARGGGPGVRGGKRKSSSPGRVELQHGGSFEIREDVAFEAARPHRVKHGSDGRCGVIRRRGINFVQLDRGSVGECAGRRRRDYDIHRNVHATVGNVGTHA